MPSSLLSSLIWLLVLGSGMLLALLVLCLLGAACAALPGVEVSKVLLECPHCGAETPASEAECRFCRRSFREESTRPRPVIDAPKLRAPARTSSDGDTLLATTDISRFS